MSMLVIGSLERASPSVCRGVCDLSNCVIKLSVSGTGDVSRKTVISGTLLRVAECSKPSFDARVRQSLEAPARKKNGAGARTFSPSLLG